MGKNGAKYFGRIGSKFLPFIGLLSLGYEAVKACNCYRVCDDGKFTDDEKIFLQ